MKKRNFARLFRTAAVLALTVAMLLTVSGCGLFGKKTDPIDKYFKGMQEYDVEQMFSAFPEEIIEALEDEDMDEYIEGMLEMLEEEYGKIKITYEVVDEDELDEDDLDDLREMMEELDMDGDDITEAWEIEVEAILETSDDEEDADFGFVVFKYNGKWYLDPTTIF